MSSEQGPGSALDGLGIDRGGEPDLVWKYARLDTAKKIIDSSELWFNCPSTFNDPFDCCWNSFWFLKAPGAREIMKSEWMRVNREGGAPFKASKDRKKEIQRVVKRLRKSGVAARDRIPDVMMEQLLGSVDPMTEAVRQSIERSARRVRVCCFSAVNSDLLMWSHYGDHHKGVVIGFRRAEVLKALNCELPQLRHLCGYVCYARNLPLPSDLKRACQLVMYRADDREDLLEMARIRVFTKADQWTYEKEWRAAVAIAAEDTEQWGERPLQVSFGSSAIAAVIGGARVAASDFAELRRLARERGISAESRGWAVHPSQFALEPRDL